ncbi:uncharacterized protein LOC130808572 [Amaranthus tricolor]|uniref:uncharacterized protein LOC130808572 n=1 Tax=Amaranthus tricolor TaxID=29722 RepID=UPI0025899D1B|nr:uncharacterized protein LOC130808572 [Amaranthus tricolor]
MASASSQPVRSISLPARNHPTTLKIEETISKLKSRGSCCSSGAEGIQLGLLNLVELYAHVQDLIPSFSTQQGKLVEEALESSVLVLDMCSKARDVILGFKQQVCDLQSALRRKGYSSFEKEISMYTSFRKKLAKDVGKCLKVLKQAEGKFGVTAPLLNGIEPSMVNLVRLFREVYSITVVVFRSLFTFLSTSTKASGWSLISRLVTKNSGAGLKETRILNEVSRVDLALNDHTKVDVMMVRDSIRALDASLQIQEGELGCLYRCLLQNRVSLLNILTQ